MRTGGGASASSSPAGARRPAAACSWAAAAWRSRTPARRARARTSRSSRTPRPSSAGSRARWSGGTAAAAPIPPPLRRAGTMSSWVSSTLISAVPIEAPTCWLMFSVVLARATCAWRSVCIAPENVGIIVAPMPEAHHPQHHAEPHVRRVGLELGQREERRARRAIRPTGHDPADAGLVAQPAGDRHRDHRAEALRGEQQAGVHRATRRAPPAGRAAAAACRRTRRSRRARA